MKATRALKEIAYLLPVIGPYYLGKDLRTEEIEEIGLNEWDLGSSIKMSIYDSLSGVGTISILSHYPSPSIELAIAAFGLTAINFVSSIYGEEVVEKEVRKKYGLSPI